MFAKRLRELRLEKMISQRQLAIELCASNQNISDWENGKSETSFDMLVKIADFFDVTIDYLLGREDLK